MQKRFGALSSSVDPNELSQTVKGIILALSAVILMVMNWLGVPLTDAQVMEFAAGAGLAAGAIWTLWGLVRKLVVWIAEVRD